VQVRSSRGHDRLRRSSGGALRGPIEVIGRSGVLVGLALVVVASALAFALTSTTASHSGLPSRIEVGFGVIASTTTSTTVTTSSSTLSTTTAPRPTTTTSTTSPGASLHPPKAKGNEQTTVIRPVPTVRVEDDKGRQIDDEGAESTSGTADHETSGDH